MEGRAQNISAVLKLLGGFLVMSVISGLLLAGLAIPAVGAVGSAAAGSVDFFNNLPHDFTSSPLAQQSRILDADGKLIVNPYDENRIVVPLKDISPWMQKAQIALEDSRFYEHRGLDPKGLTRAFVSGFTGGQVQGASTITQQYVKLTLQDMALRRGDKEAAADAVKVSYGRKIQELRYALDVEEKLTKQQILTNYLNLAYYGDQAYGVEAAAINYFTTRAKDLTIGQAALLAGIVQQPTAFNPLLNPKKAQERRNLVLDRMQALGMADAAAVKAAKAVSVPKMIKKKYTKGGCFRSPEPYFCEYVMKWLQLAPEMAVLGKTPADRLKTINQGGLTIRTSLRPKVQREALKHLTAGVPINNKSRLGAAATVIEPGTGRIIAMVQASDFNKQQVNWNVDQRYAGGIGFQFGSTAKMFTLVTALERGMSIYGSGVSPGATKGRFAVFDPEDMHDECNSAAPYEVQVHGSKSRTMSLASATAQSDNGFYVNLAVKLGGCSVRDTMIRLGMHRGDGEEIPKVISSVSLGVAEVAPMTLANAYATIAAGGKYCTPTPIVSITTPDRKQVAFKATNCKQVVDPGVAAGATKLLRGVLTGGGTGTAANWSQSRPAAGKTGTTEDNGQVWFVGYTPQLATAVWVGHPLPLHKGNRESLNGKCFGIYGCPGRVFGGTITAPIWGKIMRAASQGLPVKQFGEVSNAVLNGDYVSLPSVIGRDPASAAAILKAAGFDSYKIGTIDSTLPAGTVAATDPSGRALRNSSVGLLISTGKVATPKPTGSKTTTATKPPGPPKPSPTKKKP